jgi:hypothetical protein
MGRIVPLAIGVVIIVAGVGGLILFLQSRDDAGIDAAASAGPGTVDPGLGGPHGDDLVTQDRRPLSRDQLLNALDLGNVVLTYPGNDPPRELIALQRDLSGRFDAELAASGLAVILAPADALEGLAWRHRLAVDDPSAAQLREFAEHWLGRRGR